MYVPGVATVDTWTNTVIQIQYKKDLHINFVRNLHHITLTGLKVDILLKMAAILSVKKTFERW